MQLPRYFILTMVSWRIFAIKGGMSIFYILRVFSMGHDFFSKLDSTFSSFASNISVVLSLFTLSFEYVVAETISYHKCALYFSIRCRDHAHISLTKWDLRIPFSVYAHVCVRNGRTQPRNFLSIIVLPILFRQFPTMFISL